MRRRDFMGASAVLAVIPRATAAERSIGPVLVTIVHSRKAATGWRLGAKDLGRYLARAGLRTEVCTPLKGRKLPAGSLIVLVQTDDAELADLRARYPVAQAEESPESFRISTFDRPDSPGHRIYFLEAWDTLGAQYACYDFLERFAGVRFLHPDFEHVPLFAKAPDPINTGFVKPDFAYRGLYPWNYNYDKRGLTTFCDINAHFVAEDWPWFARLGDWLIKNKQNIFFWFDDVFDDDPLSSRFPPALKNHWRDRGLSQVLGMGWASNEGRPRGGEWDGLTCIDARGKSIEQGEWRRAICPQVPEYFDLAKQNVGKLPFKAPEAIGALIGYAENTWAAHRNSQCVRHADIPAEILMKRDLDYISDKMESVGAGGLPLGFVISTQSASDDSPFSSGGLIDALPNNGLVSVHIYQQDAWTNFADIFGQIKRRNERENASVKAVPIAEVAFLCNYDIPLFRPSILSRREAHFRSLPKDDAIGHLTTLNTTQYLYWLKSYQLMRWQWRAPVTSWGDDISRLGGDLFGTGNGAAFTDLVGRMAALDMLQPASASDRLLRSSSELKRIDAWARYTPRRHSDAFGFYLWAKGQELDILQDAEKNVAACLLLNQQLASGGVPFYVSQFFDVMALTAHYHAIRIHVGKADHAIAAAFNRGGATRDARIRTAKRELGGARSALAHYDRHLSRVVRTSDAISQASLRQDFVLNPSPAFIDSRLAGLARALREKTPPKRIFADEKT